MMNEKLSQSSNPPGRIRWSQLLVLMALCVFTMMFAKHQESITSYLENFTVRSFSIPLLKLDLL